MLESLAPSNACSPMYSKPSGNVMDERDLALLKVYEPIPLRVEGNETEVTEDMPRSFLK